MRKQVNNKTLTLAREARGFSQTELAHEVGLAQSMISRYENGGVEIDEKHLEKFSETLNFPVEFFYQQIDIYPPNLHYRKRANVPARTKEMAEAMMNIYRSNIDLLLKGFNPPDVSFPLFDDMRTQDPKEVAKFVRHYWGLPKGRIENLTQLLEEKGILVIQCDFFPDEIDGRSMVTSKGNYIIFLNKNKPGDRQRYTLAHEFAHIVMHIKSPTVLDRDIEDEANIFASEFLIPSLELAPQIAGSKLSLGKLADLKRFWRVSMQAILTWATRLGLLTKNHARYMHSQFSSMSMRTKEPIEITPEKSGLLERIIRTYLNTLSYSKKELSKMLCLSQKDFESMYGINQLAFTIER